MVGVAGGWGHKEVPVAPESPPPAPPGLGYSACPCSRMSRQARGVSPLSFLLSPLGRRFKGKSQV